MLSYQHIYHAGGPADLHKHSILCEVLGRLARRSRALSYMETHAGRGLYDLLSPESEKTGEARNLGWLAPGRAEGVPPKLRAIVQGLNAGADAPLYPGSPLVAARLLRPADRLHLMELHPQEHAALQKTFEGDTRVTVDRVDGYEGVLAHCPPAPREGLVLIDPSFEMKDEYEQVAAFISRLRNRWREGVVMLWYPLLPAARHHPMLAAIAAAHREAVYNEYEWGAADPAGGMYGSGIVLLNFPEALSGFSRL